MKKTMIILGLILIFLVSCSMSIYAVIDTTEPMIVTDCIRKDEYKVIYKYQNQEYFMHILTTDSLEVGDTLKIIVEK